MAQKVAFPYRAVGRALLEMEVDVELLIAATKRAFLSFPYVCPEPVLVKR
jgi:hypothetical protein